MQKAAVFSIFVTLSAFPLILSHFLKKYYKNLTEKLDQEDDNSYYQCIFFDYKNFECRPHLLDKTECGEACSYSQLVRLLKFIGSAKTSISMCMYMLTLKQVSSELAKASRRGVAVRLITDKGMAQTAPSLSNKSYLEKSGAQFKTPGSSDVMMHHKYCLIDERDPNGAKMFFGSLNLTAQALCKNFETVVLTNDWKVIRRFSEEFDELWELL